MKNLVKRNGSLIPELPSIFNDFLSREPFFNFPNMGANVMSNLPAVNIRETNDNYQVEMAAPGMRKDDFNIELDNDRLTISTQQQNENEEKEDNYTRREFSYRSFSRTFSLPQNVVDADKIEAKYEDGLLKLTIPKREEAKAKPARTIQIK